MYRLGRPDFLFEHVRVCQHPADLAPLRGTTVRATANTGAGRRSCAGERGGPLTYMMRMSTLPEAHVRKSKTHDVGF